MKLKLIHAGAAALVLLLGAGGLALAQSKPPGPTDYPSFSRFIAIRNIFNPERFPVTSGYHPPAVVRTKRGSSLPAFSFVGAMVYGKGMFAFFDGNNAGYRKALQVGGKIAGYTIQQIGLSSIKLEADGKTVVLPVGTKMQQAKDGTWDLAGASDGFAGQAESPGTVSAADSAPSTVPGGSGGATSDVLKRLMKLREQANQ